MKNLALCESTYNDIGSTILCDSHRQELNHLEPSPDFSVIDDGYIECDWECEICSGDCEVDDYQV